MSRSAEVALDSNILIYAELEPESDKGQRAADQILRVASDCVIPAQVLGEYLRFIQRRAPRAFGDAIRQAAIYRAAFLIPSTTDDVVKIAAEMANAHGLQLWDCVVCAAAAQAGAKVLLTEDMQDGRVLDGLRLINPFAEANEAALVALLGN